MKKKAKLVESIFNIFEVYKILWGLEAAGQDKNIRRALVSGTFKKRGNETNQ